MNSQTIEKLNQFQSILKECIKDRFKNDLPQDKVNILNNKNYINVNELKDINNSLEVQGIILRNMLNDIITIKCKKELQVGSESKSIDYGELLEKIIIEYFAVEISGRYKFQIISNSSLRDKKNMVDDIKNVFGYKFENAILNQDAKSILSNSELKNIESLFDVNAIDEYVKNASLNNDNKIENNQVNMIEYVDTTISKQSEKSIVDDKIYEELVMKYARGEKLTDEELKLLLKSTPDLMNESQIDEFTNKNTNQTLEISNSNNLGFSFLKMTVYFIIITSILGFILATIITQI